MLKHVRTHERTRYSVSLKQGWHGRRFFSSSASSLQIDRLAHVVVRIVLACLHFTPIKGLQMNGFCLRTL